MANIGMVWHGVGWSQNGVKMNKGVKKSYFICNKRDQEEKVRDSVCVCVCVRERERENERLQDLRNRCIQEQQK